MRKYETMSFLLAFGLSALGVASAAVSTNSYSSDKICFGTGDAKGDHFVLELSANSVTIPEDAKDLSSGTYTRKSSDVVKGRDGVTYLDFSLGESDGANDLLVDQDLLKPGATGLAKIRNRGESYYGSTYMCRDNNR